MKCGFWENDITSLIGTHVPGQLVERICTGVDTPVYAKAVVMENGGKKAAILEIDAVNLAPWIYRRICDRVTAMTDITEEELFISVNHVHTSVPCADVGEKVNGDDAVYLEYFVRRAADAVVLAYKNMRDCVPYFAKGSVEGVSFVRDYVMKDGSLRTNPGVGNPDVVRPLTDADTDLPLLLFKTPEGEPFGCITCFANHQDCVGPRETRINGDYCGVMSRIMKERFGSGFVNFFMLGTAGNINHVNVFDAAEQKGADGSVPKKSKNNYETIGKKLGAEAVRLCAEAKPLGGDEIFVSHAFVTGEINMPSEAEVAAAKEKAAVDENSVPAGRGRYNIRMAKRMLGFYNAFKNKPQSYKLRVSLIRIGEMAICTLPCEIFVGFGRRIKKAAGTEKIIVSEFFNGEAHWSYIPEKELFGSDLYETYLGTSNYRPDTGDKITDAVIELLKK